MYLIPIAWLYVTLMMAVAEATNTTGTVLGAIITFVLYGLAPVTLVLYFMGAPARRRAIKTREAAELAAWRATQQPSGLESKTGSGQPDAGRHAPTDPVTPVRKEP